MTQADSRKTVLIAAGGTGGHLFPASALASALTARGYRVELATDSRVERYRAGFPAEKVHLVEAGTITGKSRLAAPMAAVQLGRGFFQSLALLRAARPVVAAVGFGGYPTAPPLMAAKVLGIPVILHDANAVLGLANRMLARIATAVATSVPDPEGLGPAAARAVLTGNPVRPAVIAAAETPYVAPLPGGRLSLLVFGGSQGARVFADVVPPALALLSPEDRARIDLVQQVREEDAERVGAALAAAGIHAETAPFFTDLPARIAAAQLVVGRSGAGTVAELATIGRPSLLIPLPIARDQDQAKNAAVMAKAGAATAMAQTGFTPEALAGWLAAVLADPSRLAAEASAARALSHAGAAERLADLVDQVAAGRFSERSSAP